MPSIPARFARAAAESHAMSALPHAPVRPDRPAAARGTRRALAGSLHALADRLAPEPVERSRWQSG